MLIGLDSNHFHRRWNICGDVISETSKNDYELITSKVIIFF